jgi:hypothetical protein
MSDLSLGSNPIIYRKTDKNTSSFLPLVISQNNKNIDLSPSTFMIKDGFIFIYNINTNQIQKRPIPDLFDGFFKKSESVFINDDLVFICGGYRILRKENKVIKEFSKSCFIYSIKMNTWIAPLAIRSDSPKPNNTNIMFVSSNLLQMTYPQIDHKLILYKQSSKKVSGY